MVHIVSLALKDQNPYFQYDLSLSQIGNDPLPSYVSLAKMMNEVTEKPTVNRISVPSQIPTPSSRRFRAIRVRLNSFAARARFWSAS